MEQFRILEQFLDGCLLFRVPQDQDLSLKIFPVVTSALHKRVNFRWFTSRFSTHAVGFNGFYTHGIVRFIVFFFIVKPFKSFELWSTGGSLLVTKSFSWKKKFSPGWFGFCNKWRHLKEWMERELEVKCVRSYRLISANYTASNFTFIRKIGSIKTKTS